MSNIMIIRCNSDLKHKITEDFYGYKVNSAISVVNKIFNEISFDRRLMRMANTDVRMKEFILTLNRLKRTKNANIFLLNARNNSTILEIIKLLNYKEILEVGEHDGIRLNNFSDVRRLLKSTIKGFNITFDRFDRCEIEPDSEECMCLNAIMPVPKKIRHDALMVYKWCKSNWGGSELKNKIYSATSSTEMILYLNSRDMYINLFKYISKKYQVEVESLHSNESECIRRIYKDGNIVSFEDKLSVKADNVKKYYSLFKKIT